MHLLRRLFPWVLAGAGLCVPLFTHNEYLVRSVLISACVYVILLAGLDLVVGYSGDVSVGHAGLFAVGAYTSAILVSKLHWPWLATVPAAMALTAVFGLALGVPALRLSGPYLAVATIAFGIIIQTVINESVGLTNGTQGIRDIPRLRFGPVSLEGNNFYFLAYPLMLLALLGKHRLVTSYWGRAFEALKENALAAECSGISRYRFKLAAFVLSAVLAGLAGSLFIHITRYCGPETFTLTLSILFLIMLIFGGTRSVAGNILGALVAVYLPDFLLHAPEIRLGPETTVQLAAYQQLFFGLLLLFTLFFLPGGVVGLFRAAARRVLPAAPAPRPCGRPPSRRACPRGRAPAGHPTRRPGALRPPAVARWRRHHHRGGTIVVGVIAGHRGADHPLRRPRGGERARPGRAARRGPRAHRTERLGQVHHRQPPLRRLPAHLRPHPVRR